MHTTKTYSFDLEVIKKLSKLKNQSEFVNQACIEKLNSINGRVETKDGQSNVLMRSKI